MPSPGRGPFPGSQGLEVRHESTTIRHISNEIEENLAVAKERRRQDGGTAVANAAVTGTGGSESVAVNDESSSNVRRNNDRCCDRGMLFCRNWFAMREQALDVASDRLMGVRECILD
jgi:hypothetical protein